MVFCAYAKDIYYNRHGWREAASKQSNVSGRNANRLVDESSHGHLETDGETVAETSEDVRQEITEDALSVLGYCHEFYFGN